jgi:uncharacterized membrane protein required for colicin V production
MIFGIAWPDLAIGAVLIFCTLSGWRRGFISELTGAVALFAALLAAFYYPGAWDARVQGYTHLTQGSSHVLAMVLAGAIAYLAVFTAGFVLERIAKLPVLGTLNAFFGAVVGLSKGLVFLWVVLYVALWFPLSRDVRSDLHHSVLAIALTQPNDGLDVTIRKTFPWYSRPDPFENHKV